MNQVKSFAQAILMASALFASSQVFAQADVVSMAAGNDQSTEISWRRPRGMVCEARNRRGMTFAGYGHNRWEAERNAMANCQARSFRCHIVTCFHR